MQFSIEKVDELTRKMTLNIPTESIVLKVDEKLKSLAKKVKIAGFRPGKVPIGIVRERYGSGVRQEVVADVLKHSLNSAIEQAQIRPASMPSVEPVKNDGKESLKFLVVFEVLPDIDLKDLSQTTLEKLAAEITDSDVKEMIENLRRQHAKWMEVTKSAEKGFKVHVDFVGTIAGKLFKGGQGEDISFIIGEGNMLKDFEDGILGMKKGEEKEVEVTFPDGYHADLAGQTASFKISLKKLLRAELPKVDAEFAKLLKAKDGNVETLNDNIRRSMEMELQQKIDRHFKHSIFERLIELNPLTVPKGLIQEEIDKLRMMGQKQQPRQKKTPAPKKTPRMICFEIARIEMLHYRCYLGSLFGHMTLSSIGKNLNSA